MNIQGWFPLGLTGLISWLSKRLSLEASIVFLYFVAYECDYVWSYWNKHIVI